MTFDINNNDSSFFIDASLGFHGIQVRRVFGSGEFNQVTALTSPNFADIWSGGGTYPFMSGPTNLEAISSSANDTAAGTGARQITVNGLDAAYNEVSATVTLNGNVGPVPLSVQMRRINSVTIPNGQVGSTRWNEGVITIRDVSGATVRALVPIGKSGSKQSIFTVPDGHALLIYDIELEINQSAGGATRGADCEFYFAGPNATDPIRLPRKLSCTDTVPKNLDPKTPIFVAARNDFLMRLVYTSAANVMVSGSWEGHLFRRIP